MGKRIKHDASKKRMILDLHENGQSISSLAKEYNLNENMLYKWRKEASDPSRPAFTGNGNKALSNQEKELLQLKKENERLRQEKEILKKAMSIISSSDRTSIN